MRAETFDSKHASSTFQVCHGLELSEGSIYIKRMWGHVACNCSVCNGLRLHQDLHKMLLDSLDTANDVSKKQAIRD